jgi:hypothetical protein
MGQLSGLHHSVKTGYIPMNIRSIKFLTAGIVIVVFLIFSGIGVYNIIINQTPVFGLEANATPSEMNRDNPLRNISEIAVDDPVRDTILAEDKAWGYSWVYLQDHDNFKIYLPLKKESLGLRRITDKKENRYLVWVFGAEQPGFPVMQRYSRGGIVFIDAHDGRVIWYDQFL